MKSSMTKIFAFSILGSAVVFLAAGCNSAKPAPKPVEPAKSSQIDSQSKSEVDVKPKTEFVAPKEEVKKDELPADLKEIATKYVKDVFFDFDKYDLSEDSRSSLAADADFFKKHGTIRFTIEGHCDERGTREYNLSLGEKRANAAKEYLVALGVAENRINVISYGKERPFDEGHNEAAWTKNRRGHFVITAK